MYLFIFYLYFLRQSNYFKVTILEDDTELFSNSRTFHMSFVKTFQKIRILESPFKL